MATNHGIRERAAKLLGSGVTNAQAAAALGVTESYITQLMSESDFAATVSESRFTALQSHSDRDSRYDALEDKILDKLDKSVDWMMKPGELLRAAQVINAAKRRGVSSPDQVAATSGKVIQLSLPIAIVNQFTTNGQNQVVSAGSQQLETIQSGTLAERLKKIRESVTVEANQSGEHHVIPNHAAREASATGS